MRTRAPHSAHSRNLGSVIASPSTLGGLPEVTVPTIEAAIGVPESEVEQSIVEKTRELADAHEMDS